MGAAHETVSRSSTDLSFLDVLTSSKPTENRKYMMQKAIFSLTICGSDDRHYSAYVFVDREFNEDEDMDEDFSYTNFQQDPIASDGGGDVIDANLPVWDPREYFLVIFQLRIAMVLKEWKGFAQTITRSIDCYVWALCLNFPIFSR
jgi:hypothetical protein